jgi:hypothetical protein
VVIFDLDSPKPAEDIASILVDASTVLITFSGLLKGISISLRSNAWIDISTSLSFPFF